MPWKTPYELYARIRQKDKDIYNLRSTIESLELELERQGLEFEAVTDEVVKEYADRISELDSQVEQLTSDNKDKQAQLTKRELKKLAIEYDTQERAYKGDQDKWFQYALLAFVSIVASVLWANLTKVPGEAVTERIDRYVINLILITFLVFCLKQFSAYKDLRIDYANRKTIAQSYFNIIDSTEDAQIKERFLEASTDILVANTQLRDEAHTIPEKLIDGITEIAKNLSKKA